MSFLLRALLLAACEEGDCREGESALLEASDLIAGASRADEESAPPRVLAPSLRGVRLVVADEAAPTRKDEGD